MDDIGSPDINDDSGPSGPSTLIGTVVETVTDNIGTIAGAAYVFDKVKDRFGDKIAAEAAGATSAKAEAAVAPKVEPATGPRLSPEAWDAQVKADIQAARDAKLAAGATAESAVPAAEASLGTAAREAAAFKPAAAAAESVAGFAGRIEPTLGPLPEAAAKAASTLHGRVEPTLARTVEVNAKPVVEVQATRLADRAAVASATEVSVNTVAAPAAKSAAAVAEHARPAHAAPVKAEAHTTHVAKPHTDVHLTKVPATSVVPHHAGIEHAAAGAKNVAHSTAVVKNVAPSTAVAPVAKHEVEAGLQRALVQKAAVTEAATVAGRTLLRAAAGPEAAVAVAVLTAAPRAYSFVDEASGHAISKSAVGRGVGWAAEHSGANALASKISNAASAVEEKVSGAVGTALEKTGGSRLLEKAGDIVGRAGEASGVFAQMQKAGEAWDAGAKKLETAIRNNIHGPDNPAAKVAVAAATAATAAAVKQQPAPTPHPISTLTRVDHPKAHDTHAHAPAPAAANARPAPAVAAPTAATAAAGVLASKAVDNHAKAPAPVSSHPQGLAPAQAAPHQSAALHAKEQVAAHTPKPHHAHPHQPVTAPVAVAKSDAAPMKLPSGLSVGLTAGVPLEPLTGQAGLSKALQNHMTTHGMGPEAKTLAGPMAQALSGYLAKAPDSKESLVINATQEAAATMAGPAATKPVAGDLPRIQASTLSEVEKSGLSPQGVAEVRASFPKDTVGKSDLELADTLGGAGLAKIGKEGVSVESVAKVQEHLTSSTKGTDFEVKPDALSSARVLLDLADKKAGDLTAIESGPTGNRVVGVMSEAQFGSHKTAPGVELAAVDMQPLKKELGMAASVMEAATSLAADRKIGAPAPVESAKTYAVLEAPSMSH